ncbi:CUB domain-containing protein [Caenorhabditis elegans]|uniref:CUB domain-containing protein n=1 Tax=Caenorhabditis elegans TaxID=6239 RepID=A0A4V0IKV9_CAEEL|nr:CUB domain-containing protein [Caenorhabditis elegans]VTW47568.1 CUB domain-containing protein [Caenorhabditis elegans]
MQWKILLGIIIQLLTTSLAESDLDFEEDMLEDPIEELSITSTEIPIASSTIGPTITTKDYCHCDMEVYGLSDLNGVLKSPNFPGAHCDSGKCIYKVLPHPNMTLRLNIQTAEMSSGTTLKFWSIFNIDDKEYSLYHSDLRGYHSEFFQKYEQFTTPKNVGFKVVLEMQKNTYAFSGFKMSFDRLINETSNHLCDRTHVIIGNESTIVTASKPFALASGCMFLLSPSSDGIKNKQEEMFIEIETESPTYVAIRSYDYEGLFSRDDYFDSNRTKLVDASKVEVIFRRDSSYTDSFPSPKITARLMTKDCACPEKRMNLTGHMSSVIIRSPGFPNLYCPGKHCRILINSEKNEKRMKKDRLHPVLMILSNCSLNEYDSLKLGSMESGRLIFRTEEKNMMPTKFLRPIIIDQQTLGVSYRATGISQMRYFEMNITKLEIPEECVCSMFNDKEYQNSGWLSVVIPKNCSTIHCHWKFSTDRKIPPQYMTIEFIMDKPSLKDIVYILTNTLTEEYDSELLSTKRSIASATSPIEFTFSRFTYLADSDAVLNISWKIVEACECSQEKVYVKVDQPSVLTSPNYPEVYCPNLVCRHTFYAPKGHYLEVQISDADIEKYHDFLKIYDGNSTIDPIITRISGQENYVTINSTSNILFFLFMTDESNGNKGYHANVYARPMTIDHTLGETHWIVLICVAFLTVPMIAGVIYFVIRKKENHRQLESLHNPTISYSSSEAGSSINIAFGSSNNGNNNERCNELYG